MSLHRQHLKLHATRSIDAVAQQGKSTQHRVDGNGLVPQKRFIETVRRGDHVDRAPISETRPDRISAGRLPVFARSGNDDDQHNKPGVDHQWGLVGDLTPKEIEAEAANAQRANATALGIGAVLAIGALMLVNR